MPVHASSVISTRIQNFDSALYTAITDKENNQYTSGTNGQLTEFQPLFQNLSDALEAFFDINREATVRDFIQGIYAYKLYADMWGTSSTLLSTSDSDTVQAIDGYRSRIKTDGLTYYDDYPQLTFAATGSTITRTSGSWITDGFTDAMSISVSGTTSNNGTLTVSTSGVTATILTVDEALTDEGPIGNVIITGSGSVRMGGSKIISDIALINGAYTGQEKPDMEALVAGYLPVVAGKSFDFLFSDETPLTTLSKDDMNTYIFDTLGYRGPFSELNIGSLSIPAAP